MNPDRIIAFALPFTICWIAWIIFSTIRRYKIARLQAEVQTKLLEKVGSGQELLAYAQTEAGKAMLESLKVERIAPHGRIIGALQTGIVTTIVGVALLFLRGHIEGAEEGFLVFGTLLLALGIGFSASAAASYYLSKSFGILNGRTRT